MDGEQMLPFFKHRRACVYLAALGSARVATHRFPGADLRAMAPRWLLPFASVYLLLMGITAVGAIVVLIFIGVGGK